MTAATYTFTLSAAQSSASSMVVAMRAKTGSSIPGNASRWQGGTMPQATLNWAAGATTATATVNTAPNSTVDGNAEYEWYKVSSTPSDLTLDTSALPTVTITDDDSSGGGGGDTIVYGPQTTADSGYVQTNGPRHKLTGKLADANPCRLTVSSDATGANALLWDYIGFGQWKLYAVTDGAQTQIIQGNVSLANTPDFAMVRSADRLSLTVAGASVFDIQRTDKTGTYARYEVGGGQTVTITRLA